MGLLNPGEPLALPEGSVRAIMAMALIGASIYVTLTTGHLPDSLSSMAGVAFGYYFASRPPSSTKE